MVAAYDTEMSARFDAVIGPHGLTAGQSAFRGADPVLMLDRPQMLVRLVAPGRCLYRRDRWREWGTGDQPATAWTVELYDTSCARCPFDSDNGFGSRVAIWPAQDIAGPGGAKLLFSRAVGITSDDAPRASQWVAAQLSEHA